MSNDGSANQSGDVVLKLAKDSVSHAMRSYETYVALCRRLYESGDDPARDADANGDDAKRRALVFARENADRNFGFALQVLETTDLDEVVKLQDEFVNRQSAENARRMEELQAYASGGETAKMPAAFIEIADENDTTPSRAGAVNNDNHDLVAAAAASALLTGGAAVAASEAASDGPEAHPRMEPAASTLPALQTGELDSETIAAEIEQQVIALSEPKEEMPELESAPEPAADSAPHGDLEAEISALADKIRATTPDAPVSRDVDDDLVAEMVAEVDAEAAALAAGQASDNDEADDEFDFELESDEPGDGAATVAKDEEDRAELVDIVREDEEATAAHGADALPEVSETSTNGAPATGAAGQAELAPGVSPSQFAADLAEQLEAVRAMIRGGGSGE